MRKLKDPFVIINFKTYKEATGKAAVVLAKELQKVAIKEKKNIAIAVQATDIYQVAKAVRIPVFAQHVDPVSYGAHTGDILPEAIHEDGAIGVLINHSEDRLKDEDIERACQRAKEVGLVTVICAKDLKAIDRYQEYDPTYIAYEPPSLIGTGNSVTSKKGKVIMDAVKILEKRGLFRKKEQTNTKLIVGAGIHTPDDLVIVKDDGVAGVLIASSIVKAEYPGKALQELLKGMD